jgi:hypothetical protein
MYNRTSNSYGTYKPTRETYKVAEALAVAVAVDRVQGFVKAGQGYVDAETQVVVEDNRAVALRTLRQMNGRSATTSTDEKGTLVVVPTLDDYATAQEIFNYFDQIHLLDKMGDTLVKVAKDGRRNDYNLQLSQVFDRGEADVNKELAMLVSLPNSRRVADVREEMDRFYAEHQNRGYIGELKQRLKIAGKVMDVKYLPTYQIHLATVATTAGQIAKFFLNDKLNDMARNLRGKDVVFTGTVKKHEVNQFTRCQETVFNRIKLEDN